MSPTLQDASVMPTIALRIDDALLEDLDRLVEQLKIQSDGAYAASRSSVVKAALKQYLDRERPKRPRRKK